MKNKILDAVARLIDRYGLKKFTVNEVASVLHVSKKTLYQYFSGKDEMIRQYFEEILLSDKQSVLNAVASEQGFLEKIHDIVHSSHRYRLPVRIMDEAKQFYPDEWDRIEELKKFKLDVLKKLLRQAADEGILCPDIHFGILSAMLERVSDMFIDTDFLLENGMRATQVIDEVLKIITNGIVKKDGNAPCAC